MRPVEVPGLLVVAMVAVSLFTLVAYATGFLLLAVAAIRRRPRLDPLSEELDRVLEEILGQPGENWADGREPWDWSPAPRARTRGRHQRPSWPGAKSERREH